MLKAVSSPDRVDGIHLGEVVRAEIWRPRPGGGYNELPDEELCCGDLIITSGLNYIATRIINGDTVASAMAYMAIGTATSVATYTDTTLPGEVKRKGFAVNSVATNIYTMVATYGGSADSVTSLSIQEAGIFNHASSGQGTMYQRVNFSAWVPANSDLLKLTLQTNVGSR